MHMHSTVIWMIATFATRTKFILALGATIDPALPLTKANRSRGFTANICLCIFMNIRFESI